jgi:hypothetical protein
MKIYLLYIVSVLIIFTSCEKEEDHHDHDHDEGDTTAPVIDLTSPSDSSVFHNGDTVFISGTVSDNGLHTGTILIKNDTTAFEYFNQLHEIHIGETAIIEYMYIVSGITQNEMATFTASYSDHTGNPAVLSRKMVFMP